MERCLHLFTHSQWKTPHNISRCAYTYYAGNSNLINPELHISENCGWNDAGGYLAKWQMPRGNDINEPQLNISWMHNAAG